MSADGTHCICLRVQDGCVTRRDGTPVAAKGAMGWLHVIDPKAKKGKRSKSVQSPGPGRLTVSEVKSILKEHKSDLSAKLLGQAAELLNVTEGSLIAYGIGWDRKRGVYSFPMFDGKRRPCGIRLRSRDGKFKGCVPGSRNGLFIPNDYAAMPVPMTLGDDWPYLLVLPEGPTSAAAARDFHFRAIGRPNNNSGALEMLELLREPGAHPQDVCVGVDRDGARWVGPDKSIPIFPGYEGGLSFAETILPACGRLRFFQPPLGTKDFRQWIGQGEFDGVAKAALCESDIVTPDWLVAKHAWVEEWREGLRRKRAAKAAQQAA